MRYILIIISAFTVLSSSAPKATAQSFLYVNDGFVCRNNATLNNERKLFRGEKPVSISSTQIIYEKDQSLWSYDTQTRSHAQLEIVGTPNIYGSPSARLILYVKDGYIWLSNTSGRNQKQLVKGTDPQWINDNSFYYTDEKRLLLFDIENDFTKVVLFNQKSARHSGGKIAYNLDTGPLADARNVVVFPLDDAGKTVGSSKLMLYGDEEQSRELYFLDHIVGVNKDKYIDNIVWSPDSKTIAFSTFYVVPTSGTAPKWIYSIRVYNIPTKDVITVSTNLLNVSQLSWITSSKLAVSLFNDVTYWGSDKKRDKVKVILADRALTPEIFDRVGLDRRLLDRDRIFVYDIGSGRKESFSGHALNVESGR